MPNFLIVGAAKAGTTALYHYLEQHPQIYMSPTKEPNFFALEGEMVDFRGPGDQAGINRRSITDIETYRAQFCPAAHHKALGEASTLYLYNPKAPQRIRHHVPDAKLIVMLRNPVERAFSAYLHLVRDNREPCQDFTPALEAEEARIRDNWQHLWHYKQMGFYAAQLKRYFDTFDAGQIKVYLYDDFKAAPADVLRDIFMFLGVDAGFVPDTQIVKSNVSGIPKYPMWHAFLSTPNPVKSLLKVFLPYRLRRPIANRLRERNLVKPELTPELRQHLIAIYREDILQLEDLLQRDLSKWFGHAKTAVRVDTVGNGAFQYGR